jgi:DNA-binding NarL/FixJ family response regulator
MATIPVSVEENAAGPMETGASGEFIRVIVADSQAIYRAGLRKIFALEDDIRVVGQAETFAQTLSAVKKFTAGILIFEAELAPNAVDAVADIMRQAPALRLVVVTESPDEDLTLDLFRRGVHAIVSREIEPEFLVDCLRKVVEGKPWLDSQGIEWVLQAYRTQGTRPATGKARVQLSPKESLIVSCVTQGMKNKEIAVRVGTTEQVVKNYLRKVYDKLGVADRLELALFCLNNRVTDRNGKNVAVPETPAAAPGAPEGATADSPANNSEVVS